MQFIGTDFLVKKKAKQEMTAVVSCFANKIIFPR